jgi:tetratricopeptide (TPR) repeat protein
MKMLMSRFLLPMLLACCVGTWAQSAPAGSASNGNSPSSTGSPPSSQASDSSTPAKPIAPRTPDLSPPRSDRVDANSLPNDAGDSSSKDSQIDLSPPANDDKAHAGNSGVLMDEGSGSVDPIHPWNPHISAKDVEVGDFYFKRGNFRAAEDRYREALLYKPNDAIATFRLAESLEKLDRLTEAREGYESYLKILPDGPEAKKAKKALDRLNENSKNPAASIKPVQ